AVEPGDFLQHATESGTTVPVRRGKVGAPEKDLPLGGKEPGERPASFARERPDLSLIPSVDLGMLVAVDLDRNKMLEQQTGDLGVRVRALVHDVAPVTPGGSDVEQDRSSGPFGQLERLGPPRVPLDRLLGRASKVGGGAVREPPAARSAGPRFGGRAHGPRGSPAPFTVVARRSRTTAVDTGSGVTGSRKRYCPRARYKGGLSARARRSRWRCNPARW